MAVAVFELQVEQDEWPKVQSALRDLKTGGVDVRMSFHVNFLDFPNEDVLTVQDEWFAIACAQKGLKDG